MQIEELNHVAIYVKDLDKSIRFYQETLGFKSIPRPAFDFQGAWFRLGEHQELHLIAVRNEELKIVRQNHFALKVKSIREVEAHFKVKKIPYSGPKPRPDGALQIFIQDPDGYFIEFFEFA